jgi:hypothetical protein
MACAIGDRQMLPMHTINSFVIAPDFIAESIQMVELVMQLALQKPRSAVFSGGNNVFVNTAQWRTRNHQKVIRGKNSLFYMSRLATM